VAVSVIQRKGAQSSGEVASLPFTLDSSSANDNLILLWVDAYNLGRTITVDDNKGNSYPQVGTTQTNGSYRLMCFACRSISGGAAHQITVHSSGGNSYLTASAVEVSGTDPLAAIVTSFASGSSAAPSSGGITAALGDFLAGGLLHTGSTTTIAPDAPWTETYEAEDNSTNVCLGASDLVAGTAGLIAASWALGASKDWVAGVALVPAEDGEPPDPAVGISRFWFPGGIGV
jgi:hypothetical protein